MKLESAVIIAVASLALGSCLAVRELTRSDRERVDELTASIAASLQPGDPLEAGLVRSAGRHLLLYAAALQTPETLDRFDATRGAAGLREFIQNEFGLTPMELGFDAMVFWEGRSPYAYPPGKTAPLSRATEHFSLRYFPGTPAEADIEAVARLAEIQWGRLLEFCDPDGRLRPKFDGNQALLEGKAITLLLPPNAAYWNSFNATARVEFGAGIDDRGRPRVTITIGLPYYNATSTAVLVHEITHIVDLMLKADFGKLSGCRTEGDLKRWMKVTFDTFWPHDTPLGEGFAEYAAFRFSAIHRLLMITPEAMLNRSAARRPVRDGILLRSPVAWDRKTRLFQYTELNSLVRFLVERFGERRFLDFYFTPPLNEKRFSAEFGMTYRQAEEEWKKWLAGQ